jgi:hypothetical protein
MKSGERVRLALRVDEWVGIQPIADRVGASYVTARSVLHKMFIDGKAERRMLCHRGIRGRIPFEYRRAHEGNVRPLYESTAGCDIEPLAGCFGGYTLYRSGMFRGVGSAPRIHTGE